MGIKLDTTLKYGYGWGTQSWPNDEPEKIWGPGKKLMPLIK